MYRTQEYKMISKPHVAKPRNGLAVSIPASVAERPGIQEGSAVDIRVFLERVIKQQHQLCL